MDNLEEEIRNTKRIVDQLLTCHSILRDRYSRLSLGLDLSLMFLSVSITFLAFANDTIKDAILPAAIRGEFGLSLFALLILVASLIQWRVAWKERTNAHKEAASALAEFKHELSSRLRSERPISADVFQELTKQYQYLNKAIAKIPEKVFLKLKRKHKMKVEVSRLLDTHPGAWPRLLAIKMTLRDNFGIPVLRGSGHGNQSRSAGRNASGTS